MPFVNQYISRQFVLTIGSLLLFHDVQASAETPATQIQQQQQADSRANVTSSGKTLDNLLTERKHIKVKSLADLRKSSDLGWQVVNLSCSDPSSTICAQASVAEVNLECSDSGKFFRRQSSTWTWINFSMVIASSVFTGVGASTTITNAKVFSTLGASTALGTVSTTAMTNAAADQGGILAIGSTLDSFLKFIQTGVDGKDPADADLIYKSAPIYAAKCVAAASTAAH